MTKACAVPTRRSWWAIPLGSPGKRRWLALGALAVLAAGCPSPADVPTFYTPDPVELNGGLVLRNPARQQVAVLSATAGAAALTQFDYAGAPSVQLATADQGKALWLEPVLRRLTSTDGKTVQVYALPSEFAGVASSDDGHAAVLLHPAGSDAATSLVNTDEVALVDLDQPASATNPRTATIAGLGRAPLRARLAPPITATGGVHRLLWVEAPGRIGLCDFGPAGQVRTAVVPLAADPQATLAPIRGEVRVTGDKADIYLLVDYLNDVIHIRVDLAAPQLDVSLDQLAAGADPADLHVFDTTAGLRVLVTNLQAKTLSVLDPATGSGLEIPLLGLATQFRRIPAPDGQARVLAWAPGYAFNFLYVVNLDDLAKKKGKAVEKITFDYPIVDLLPVAGKVLVRHQSAEVGLSLLDVVGGTSTQFKGTGNLVDLRAIDGASGATAWLLGSNGSDLRLSRIDLATLHGDSTPLHAAGQEIGKTSRLYRVGDGLAVVGAGLAGKWAMWLPNQPIVAKNMVWFEGFALDQWLGGGAQ